MKQYLVFIIQREAIGFGWSSFSGDYDSLGDAIEKATSIKTQKNKYAQVVDTAVVGTPEDQIIKRYGVFWEPESFREYKKHSYG